MERGPFFSPSPCRLLYTLLPARRRPARIGNGTAMGHGAQPRRESAQLGRELRGLWVAGALAGRLCAPRPSIAAVRPGGGGDPALHHHRVGRGACHVLRRTGASSLLARLAALPIRLGAAALPGRREGLAARARGPDARPADPGPPSRRALDCLMATPDAESKSPQRAPSPSFRAFLLFPPDGPPRAIPPPHPCLFRLPFGRRPAVIASTRTGRHCQHTIPHAGSVSVLCSLSSPPQRPPTHPVISLTWLLTRATRVMPTSCGVTAACPRGRRVLLRARPACSALICLVSKPNRQR